MRLELGSRTKGHERPTLKKPAVRGIAAVAIAGILLAPTAGCTNAENNNNNINYKPTSPSIVLVDFGNLTPDQETSMTNTINTLVGQATNGILTPQLTFVDASQEAQDFFTELANMTPDPSCTNDLLPASFASGAADVTMDLNEYDAVVAFSPKPFCEDNVVGATDHENKRTIDVSLNPRGEILQSTPDRAAAHEILHTYDWGHEGRVTQENGEFLTRINGTSLDIISYLQTARFNDYGDQTNLMGSFAFYAQPDAAPVADPIQLDMLREDVGDPYREGVIVSGEDWTTINRNDPNQNPYAKINLVEGITLSTSLTDPDPLTFSQAALIPHWTENGIDSIMVSFIDPRDNRNQIYDIVSLHPNIDSSAENTWTLQLFNQEIHIQVDGNTMSVKTIA